MNLKKTDITLVLDRSGSMVGCKQVTIDAVNEFFNGQKYGLGACAITLVQFDDAYMPQFVGQNVHGFVPLTGLSYTPEVGGMTALREAIGRTINATGERLNKMKEADRPGTVLFVIQTDGLENASAKEWTQERIKEMIAHQTDKYSWNFVFLGADMDAITAAREYGLEKTSALSYGKDFSRDTFSKMSANTNAVRSAKGMGLVDAKYEVSEEDRKEAVGETN